VSLWDILHLIARILLSAMFIRAGYGHLVRSGPLGDYAKAVGRIPLPQQSVFVSGLMLLVGGLAILLGFHPRIGATLIFIFLLVAAFTMHKFWAETDPMQRAGQEAQFWKNITLAGAMLWIMANPHWPWPWALGNNF
jgi:putative oxidoreductase